MTVKKSEIDVLFNNVVFPVIITDFQLKRVLRVNDVFIDWFRQPEPDMSLIAIEGNQLQIIGKLRNDGLIKDFPMTVQHSNGKKIECLGTASAAIDPNKKEEIIIIIHESLENREETKELKKRSANLYALSENIDATLWTVDSGKNLVNYNSKFEISLQKHFGISKKINNPTLEKQALVIRDLWSDRYDTALNGKKITYIDEMLGGTFETTLIPILSEENEVIGICCALIDITGKINTQKNLEVIQKRFTNILNSSTEGAIIATDPQGIIRQFNSGASIMLGYSPDEIIGKTSLLRFFSDSFMEELIHDIFIQKGVVVNKRELFNFISEHPELVNGIEWFFINKKGKVIYIKVSISSVLMDNRDFAGILIIAQDISELKKVKEELEIAKHHAEESSRIKSSFLANMSHEIRTPLNGIIGMTDLLKTTPLNPLQQNYSSIILKSARSLQMLINDILDYSKIEAGKMKLDYEPFSLKGLMSDIQDVLLISVNEKKIHFKITIDPYVSDDLVGDPGRIKQILLNLIGNALKFTLNGSIEIEIYQISEVQRDITLYFKVIDTGIGISDEEKNLLFKSFSQVDTKTTRKYGGSGLGLAISRELVSMMDGEIGVLSKKNEGSTFWFTIKLKKELQSKNEDSHFMVNSKKSESKVLSANLQELDINIVPPDSDDQEIIQKKIKVLVAEDNKINQLVALNFLKKIGYEADIVENGEKAVEAFKSKTYDLILMDQMMPVMDGIEATRKIRTGNFEGKDQEILIIALTANAMKGDRERLLESGMDDYISKPVLLNDMKAIIEKNLKKKGIIRS
jgi:PAS domain S-box-containing protein